MKPMSAEETALRVRRGDLSARDVALDALARADRLGGALGAFAAVTSDLALREAQSLDERVARGADPGPLAGVPCPIKDLVEVAGVPFQAGSAALRGNVGVATDAVAQRLRAAGTVMVGKTSVPEFGFPCYTEPAGLPPARTPWDPRRGAGGSSGGAAAAVAAGIVPLAHASDGGGSIRIPAASCGLVGLKVTRGLVPSGPLRVPGPGLGTDGVLSRTVRDTALALDVLAAADDPFARVVAGAGSFRTSCDGGPPAPVRVGVLTDPVISAGGLVHPSCREAARAAADWLADLGHRVGEAPVPFPEERWAAFRAVWTVGSLTIPVSADAEPLLTPLTCWLREQGRLVSGAAYAQAIADIQRLTYEVADAWATFDVVVTPTLAQPPARVGDLRDDDDPAADFAAQVDYTPWTSVANLTGRPSLSLPLHRAVVEGAELPIGVMLTGRAGDDRQLLRLAAQLEEAHPWPLLAPDYS